MYSDKHKRVGEHGSVAEELLAEVPELEQKCKAVEKAVREGYFTLGEALVNYRVSEIEYIPYLLLKHNQKLKSTNKQEQVFDTIHAVISVFSSSASSFNDVGKRAFSGIQKIAEQATSESNLLTKAP